MKPGSGYIKCESDSDNNTREREKNIFDILTVTQHLI